MTPEAWGSGAVVLVVVVEEEEEYLFPLRLKILQCLIRSTSASRGPLRVIYCTASQMSIGRCTDLWAQHQVASHRFNPIPV